MVPCGAASDLSPVLPGSDERLLVVRRQAVPSVDTLAQKGFPSHMLGEFCQHAMEL